MKLKWTHVIAVVVLLGILGIWDPFGLKGMLGLGAVSPPTGTTTPADTISCKGGQSQSLDMNAFDIDQPTDAQTEAHNIYRECGSLGSLGTWTEGTAITGLQTGTCVEFLPGIDATASNCYDNSYGPVMRVANLPCIFTANIPFMEDEVEGSVTATWYNSNHDASYEVLAASTPTTVFARFYAADGEYYGNPWIGRGSYLGIDFGKYMAAAPRVEFPLGERIGNHRPEYPNTYCVQLNTTNFNQPKWVKAELQDGSVVEMHQVPVPNKHSAAAGHADYCYEAPILTGEFIEFQIRLDPKAAAVSNSDDTSKYYAASWFANTETGELSWGSEDNDANAIGASDPDTLALDFTA